MFPWWLHGMIPSMVCHRHLSWCSAPTCLWNMFHLSFYDMTFGENVYRRARKIKMFSFLCWFCFVNLVMHHWLINSLLHLRVVKVTLLWHDHDKFKLVHFHFKWLGNHLAYTNGQLAQVSLALERDNFRLLYGLFCIQHLSLDK